MPTEPQLLRIPARLKQFGLLSCPTVKNNKLQQCLKLGQENALHSNSKKESKTSTVLLYVSDLHIIDQGKGKLSEHLPLS